MKEVIFNELNPT